MPAAAAMPEAGATAAATTADAGTGDFRQNRPPPRLQPLAAMLHEPAPVPHPASHSTALRRAPAAPGLQARIADEASPTVVHVSIGRVELVAQTPPATPRARPAARTSVALADYLRGQRGPERGGTR